MKFEPYIDRGGLDENGFFKPASMGTKMIAENEADELLLERLIELEIKREEAWIKRCIEGLFK